MGKENLAVNRLLERKEIFADLMNGTVFEGKQMLTSGQLKLLPEHAGIFYEREDGRPGVLERWGDVKMEASLDSYHVIFLDETQNKVDYAMPVRNMLQDALEYVKQVQELEKQHKMEGNRAMGSGFLSGIFREDHLKPVITVVLYLGERWDGSRSLYELLDIDETDERARYLKKYLPDYTINLIEAAHLEHPEWFQTCLQHIFNMLKYNSDKKHLYAYMKTHQTEFEQMDDVETRAALVLLGEQKRVEKLLKKRREGGTLNMCRAIDELIEDGRAEGLEAGRREGIEEGMKEGIKEGQNRAFALFHALLRDNRQDLINKMSSDLALREQLYREYGM